MFLRYLVLALLGFSLVSCGDQPPSNVDPDKTPTPGGNLPPPDSKTMQEALQGTWCYYSAVNGYPLYLGIKVEGENFQVASIYDTYVSAEGVVDHPVTDPLAFREVQGVIDESDGVASIPLPSALGGDLTIFNNSVPLLFNGITKNYIKVKYGPNKIGFFKKMDSSPGETCPALKVLPEELERLPQVDDDGDGFMDYRDNCPKIANTDQTDGDQDGEGNVCEDPCDDTTFDASCSPPSDFDEDGVDDFVDNCPEISNSDQQDSDGNGIGDACQTATTCPAEQTLVAGQCLADADDDGVEDSKDNCPVVANSDQGDIDGDEKGDGCDEDIDGDGEFNDTIPGFIITKANEFLISNFGKDFFQKFIHINWMESFYREASTYCIQYPENCPYEFLQKPNYEMSYSFKIPEKPYVDAFIGFVLDADGNVVLEAGVSGVPNCVQNPNKCDFQIDQDEAIAIAKETGLAPGLKDWRVAFYWSGDHLGYVWGVSNILTKLKPPIFESGEEVIIDSHSGEVLEVTSWSTEINYANN